MSVIRISNTKDPNTIVKNNILFGFNRVGYGPTINTGFHAGLNIPNQGYILYEIDVSNNLRMYSLNNDTQLINIINLIGGSVNTISDALNWSANNPNILLINKRPPNIETNDLSLYLDSELISSYPTIGSDWFDFSDYNVIANISSGVTFSTQNDGVFIFNSINDSISIPNQTFNLLNTNSFTIETIFGSNNPNPGIGQIYAMGDGSLNNSLISMSYNNNSGLVSFNYNVNGGLNATLNTSRPILDTNLHQTFQIIDKNSGLMTCALDNFVSNSVNITSNSITTGDTLTFGGYPMSLDTIRIYNRALSNIEILNNYQSVLPRLLNENIVTDGLVYYFDSALTRSYIGTGNTINDISGYNNNSVLTNGATFLNGTISLDGINDYIISNSNINIFGRAPRTLQIWVNLNSASYINNDIHSLLRIGGSSEASAFEILALYISSSNQFISLLHFFGSISALSVGNINRNTWTMITATYDGLTRARISLNDSTTFIEGGNTRNNIVLNTLNSMVEVGRPSFPAGHKYGKGAVGQVKIYNKSLSQDEINQNFNAQKSRYGI